MKDQLFCGITALKVFNRLAGFLGIAGFDYLSQAVPENPGTHKPSYKDRQKNYYHERSDYSPDGNIHLF
jgi:hypothetical protein